jgi:hypothetical protein
MRLITLFALLSALIALPSTLHAETEWLPPEVAEAMAQQLTVNIRAVDRDGEVAPGDSLNSARLGIAGMVDRIDSLGLDRMLELAPDFEGIDLPPSGQPHLDAIARYGICSFSLDAVYMDESPREGGLEQRVTAAVMSISIPVISSFFRHHYLAAGTTDEAAKDFLAGEALNTISAEIQTSADLLQSTMNRCATPLTEIMR